jgi:hypothetical protein
MAITRNIPKTRFICFAMLKTRKNANLGTIGGAETDHEGCTSVSRDPNHAKTPITALQVPMKQTTRAVRLFREASNWQHQARSTCWAGAVFLLSLPPVWVFLTKV